MSSLLPTLSGQDLSYNGVVFDPMYTSSIQGEPVYDDARRLVKMLRWTISVSAKITPDKNASPPQTDTDTILGNLRQDLTEPGMILTYSKKGFGDFVINGPSDDGGPEVWDVDWGPKPELLSFKPIGNSLAAMVEWRCVVCIPECPTAVFKNALMMLNYDVAWNINKDGYSVISYSGAIEIPITFSEGKKTLPDNADNYRHLAAPKVNIGFQREQKYHLSKDRKRLEFSVTDTELPVPLPIGTSLCNIKHKVHSAQTPYGFIRWVNTISGTIRVVPPRPRTEAFDKFWNIAQYRMTHTTNSRQTLNKQSFCNVMITEFSAEEDIFGLDNHFSLTYMAIGYTLGEVIRVSGLFNPTPYDNYNTWSAENSQTAGHFRGLLGSKFGNEDMLVDLCVPAKPPSKAPVTGDKGSSTITTTRYGPSAVKKSGSKKGVFTPSGVVPVGANLGGGTGGVGFGIDPGSSWLSYICEVQLKETDNVIVHKPLAGKVQPKKVDNEWLGNVTGIIAKDATGILPVAMTVPDRIQRTGSPSTLLRLVGQAIRFGFGIAPPFIESIEGKNLTQQSREMGQSVIGVIQGIPIIKLWWDIGYLLTEVVGEVLPVVLNPALQTNGAESTLDLPTFIQGQ